jgi:FAD/FMN-containing dehydrogenase
MAAAGTATVPCVVDVRRLGGALGRPPEVPDAVSFRDAGWIVRVLSASDGHTAAALDAAHGAVLRPLDAIGRSAGFLYGPVPAAPEELHEPGILTRLRRIRERVDPDGRFAASSRIAP